MVGGRGELELTKKGERALRTGSFETLFANLRKDAAGDHRVPHAGTGLERLPETRPYVFGDALSLLSASETLSNAVRRGAMATSRLGLRWRFEECW